MAASSDKNDDKRPRQFSFIPLEGKKLETLENKETKEFLTKWDFNNLNYQCYSFDKHFQSYQKDDFFLDFFQDPSVYSTLYVTSSSAKVLVQRVLGTAAGSVEVTSIPCSILSMTFFDRLYSEGIVRESHQICKCFDEYYEGFQISDELRKMLLLEDSDNYEEYTDDERNEFLFRLFKHLCLGGPVCQFEDSVKPYLDITKSFYRDIIKVQKDPSTKNLMVSSLVFSVTAYDKDRFPIYPGDKEHEQTFAYVVIDPLKRHVSVLSHKHGGSIW